MIIFIKFLFFKREPQFADENPHAGYPPAGLWFGNTPPPAYYSSYNAIYFFGNLFISSATVIWSSRSLFPNIPVEPDCIGPYLVLATGGRAEPGDPIQLSDRNFKRTGHPCKSVPEVLVCVQTTTPVVVKRGRGSNVYSYNIFSCGIKRKTGQSSHHDDDTRERERVVPFTITRSPSPFFEAFSEM